MRLTFSWLSVVLGLTPVVWGNVGVFVGYGHGVELCSTDDVQMVSEDITIVPGRGRFLFDGTVRGMDRVEYICKFKLKNRSDREIKIQVGMPLDSDLLGAAALREVKTSELVVGLTFVAQEEGRAYTVRYCRNDKSKRFKHVFLWDMTFAPGEQKELAVSYAMPMSMGLASTAKTFHNATHRKGPEHKKKWYALMQACTMEFFGYVTETGKSWKGDIEHARFRVYAEGFETYLKRRGHYEDPHVHGPAPPSEYSPVREPSVYRHVTPDGWKMDDKGFICWEFRGFQPTKPIEVRYLLLNVPQTTADTQRLVGQLFPGGPTKEDIEDLEGIIRAYYGEPPGNPRIKPFLENQIWYPVKTRRPVPPGVVEVLKQRQKRAEQAAREADERPR